MKEKLIKTYHLFFYKLVKFTYYMNRRHYNYYELKDGLFGATIAEGILITVFIGLIIIAIEILLGQEIFDRKGNNAYYGIIVFAIVSYLIPHYTLISKDKWRKYEKEFESYSKKRNRKINRIIVFLIILLFVLFVFSIFLLKMKYDANLILSY